MRHIIVLLLSGILFAGSCSVALAAPKSAAKQQIVGERKEKLQGERRTKVQTTLERMVKRMQDAHDLLEAFADRIEAQMQARASKGGDVTAISSKLEEARTKLADVDQAIADLGTKGAKATDHTKPRNAFRSLKTDAEKARDALKTIRTLLGDILISLKSNPQ